MNMNAFENDLNFFKKMSDEFDKSSIINKIMEQGIVPIINNGRLVFYQIKPNSIFNDLKNELKTNLSEFYTIYGVYDVYNVHSFNTPSSHFVSLRSITLDDAKKYQGFNKLSEDKGNDKLESVYNYLMKNGFKACTIQNYPRLYQIMNAIEEKIDLDFMTKNLCKYINTDYNYDDVIKVEILSKNYIVSDWETSKEEELNKDERVEMLNKLYNCFNIYKLDNYDYKENKQLVLDFARRNTDILNSEGFKALADSITPKGKVMIKK